MHRVQVPRGAPPLSPERTGAGEPPGAGGTSHQPAIRGTKGPFLLAGLVVVADQLTKIWAVAALSDGPVDLIGDTVQFRLTRNPGGAFSLLTGFTPLLALLATAMVVIIIRTARRTDDRPIAYGLGLVLGGAVGNLIDRLVRDPGFLSGHVVDFIRVSWWPTFNVADSAITIGVLVILWRSLRR